MAILSSCVPMVFCWGINEGNAVPVGVLTGRTPFRLFCVKNPESRPVDRHAFSMWLSQLFLWNNLFINKPCINNETWCVEENCLVSVLFLHRPVVMFWLVFKTGLSICMKVVLIDILTTLFGHCWTSDDWQRNHCHGIVLDYACKITASHMACWGNVWLALPAMVPPV